MMKAISKDRLVYPICKPYYPGGDVTRRCGPHLSDLCVERCRPPRIPCDCNSDLRNCEVMDPPSLDCRDCFKKCYRDPFREGERCLPRKPEYNNFKSSRLGIENFFRETMLIAQLSREEKIKAGGAGVTATKTATTIAVGAASSPGALKEGAKAGLGASPFGGDGPSGFVNRTAKEIATRAAEKK